MVFHYKVILPYSNLEKTTIIIDEKKTLNLSMKLKINNLTHYYFKTKLNVRFGTEELFKDEEGKEDEEIHELIYLE